MATTWDYNVGQVKGFVSQQVDGVVGLLLLVVGFALQAWSNWWQTAPTSVFLIGLILLASLIPIWIAASECLEISRFHDGPPRGKSPAESIALLHV